MKETKGLKAWMNIISNIDLPSLNSVVKAICDLSDDDNSSADQFTQLVLRDADLTSQVLKVANSVHYNRSFNPIKTVSRAIIQIGYVDLKNIALASTLIDGFLVGKPRQRLINSLADSFHAAVQARAIAEQVSGDDHEEVFIAGLLLRIGDLALLATGRQEVDDFMEARDREPDQSYSLSIDYLGVGLQTISRSLIQEWGLGDLVSKATEQLNSADPWVKSVQFGDQISRSLHLGIDHPDMKKVIRQVSEFQQRPIADVREHILLMAEEASSVASSYGAERLIEALPKPQALEATAEDVVTKTDYDIQRYLNRMSRCIMDSEPLPKLLQLAVRALNRGSGLDRVVISLHSARDNRIEPVVLIGGDAEHWRSQLTVDLNSLSAGESLSLMVKSQKPTRYNERVVATGVLKAWMDGPQGMLVALHAGERFVGLIYVDHKGSDLTDRHFEELQLVANQVNMYLKFNLPSK